MARTIIRDVRLFDGTGATPRDRSTVVVDDERIAWCGRQEDAPAAAGADAAAMIDGAGRTLLPGLIDAHAHLFAGRGQPPFTAERAEVRALLDAITHARQCLEAGVTAVRDLGARWGASAVDLAAAIARGELSGPEIVAAARFIAPSGGYMEGMAREAATPDEARTAAEEQVAAGARVLKLIASPVPPRDAPRLASDSFGVEAMRAVAEVAHTAGLRVTAHAHGLAGARDAVAAGVDCIEHGYRLDQATVDEMAARGVWLVPTLVAMEASQAPNWAPGRPDEAARRARERWEAAVAAVQTARMAGVQVAAGTDCFGIVPVTALWREVRLLVEEGGYTPAAALYAATGAAAALLGIPDHTGTVAPRMAADLVLLEGNALSDLPDPARIVAVWRRGVRVR